MFESLDIAVDSQRGVHKGQKARYIDGAIKVLKRFLSKCDASLGAHVPDLNDDGIDDVIIHDILNDDMEIMFDIFMLS